MAKSEKKRPPAPMTRKHRSRIEQEQRQLRYIRLGAAVVVARRGGAIHTFDSLNHFFFINQMIVPGSNYWNMGFGREIGEVEKDEEAKETMALLGQNMAWLIKKLQDGHE